MCEGTSHYLSITACPSAPGMALLGGLRRRLKCYSAARWSAAVPAPNPTLTSGRWRGPFWLPVVDCRSASATSSSPASCARIYSHSKIPPSGQERSNHAAFNWAVG
ncbi:hypothetical protein LIA77_03975 [Sarocladium implicatum]|nr:hypothetical protein LIA77_03975 [Sarocladium implicatum]